MRKKIISILVCMLLVITVLPVSGTVLVRKTSNPLFNGNTLYVGGDGPGNYTKIQDAIDDASDGDTVFVFDNSSPYYERLIVDKSINLIGENKNTTVIDGNGGGIVLQLYADWVDISGFTIRNGEEMGICISSNYNTISGNIVTSTANIAGINLYESNNNIIKENLLTSNFNGVNVHHSNNNTITGNNISNNNVGLYVLGSDNNFIKDNIFTSNNFDDIDLCGSHNNTISGNNVSNNKYGISLDYSNYNNITRNNIQDNDRLGLFLSSANYNVIKSNNFIGNKIQAFFIFSWGNNWDENYWDNWIGFKINLPIFPKVIIGFLGINFDWHPAQEPYDIGV